MIEENSKVGLPFLSLKMGYGRRKRDHLMINIYSPHRLAITFETDKQRERGGGTIDSYLGSSLLLMFEIMMFPHFPIIENFLLD
jgi:hypothetical protein